MADASSFPNITSTNVPGADAADSWFSSFDFMLIVYIVLGLVALFIVLRLVMYVIRKIKRQGEVNSLKKDLMVRRVLSKLSQGGDESDTAKSELNLKLSLIDLAFKQGQDLIAKQSHLGKNKAWFVMLGEPSCGKTTLLEQSDTELQSSNPQSSASSNPSFGAQVSGGAGIGGVKGAEAAGVNTAADNSLDSESPALQFYVGHSQVVLDISGKVFFDHWAGGSSAEYTHICRLINKKHHAEPLRGILLCIPADALLADDSKLTQKKALLIVEELWRLTSTLNQYLPCYVLITKLDVVLGFREYFESQSEELKDQALGLLNPYGEQFDPSLIEQFFAKLQARLYEGAYALFASKEVFDLTYQGKSRLDKSAGIYLFAQNFAKLQNNLLLYLNTIFTPQSKNYAFFRGLFFTSAQDDGYCLDNGFAYLAHQSMDEAPFVDPNYRYSRAYFIKDTLSGQIFTDPPCNHFNHSSQVRRDIPRYVAACACSMLSIFFLYGVLFAAPHLKQVLSNEVLYYSSLDQLMQSRVIEQAPLLGINQAGQGFTMFELPMPHDSTVSRLSFFSENQSHLRNTFSLPLSLLPGAICSFSWDLGSNQAERGVIYDQLQTQMVYLPLVRGIERSLSLNHQPLNTLSRDALFALMAVALYRDLNTSHQINDSYVPNQALSMINYLYPMLTTNIRTEILYFLPQYDRYSKATNDAIVLDEAYARACRQGIRNWEQHWIELSNYPESNYQKLKVDIRAAERLINTYQALNEFTKIDLRSLKLDELQKLNNRNQQMISSVLEDERELDDLVNLLWLEFQQQQRTATQQGGNEHRFFKASAPVSTTLTTPVPTDFKGGSATAYTTENVPNLSLSQANAASEVDWATTPATNSSDAAATPHGSADQMANAAHEMNEVNEVNGAPSDSNASEITNAELMHQYRSVTEPGSQGITSDFAPVAGTLKPSEAQDNPATHAQISTERFRQSSLLDQSYADYLSRLRYDFAFFKYFDQTRRQSSTNQRGIYFGEIDFSQIMSQQPKVEKALAQEYLHLKTAYLSLQHSPLFSPRVVLQSAQSGAAGGSASQFSGGKAGGLEAGGAGAGGMGTDAGVGNGSSAAAGSNTASAVGSGSLDFDTLAASSIQELKHNFKLNYMLFAEFLKICQLPLDMKTFNQHLNSLSSLTQTFDTFINQREFLLSQQQHLNSFLETHKQNAFIQSLAPIGKSIINLNQQALAIACYDKILSFYPQGNSSTAIMGQLSHELSNQPFGLNASHPIYTFEYEEILGTPIHLRSEYNPGPFIAYLKPLLYINSWLQQHAVNQDNAADRAAQSSSLGSSNRIGSNSSQPSFVQATPSILAPHQEGESQVCEDVILVYRHIQKNPRLEQLQKVFSSYAGSMINYYAQMADHIRLQMYAYSDFHELARNSRAYEINDKLHSLYDLSYQTISAIDNSLLSSSALNTKKQALEHLSQRLESFSVKLNDDCAATLTAWSLLPGDALSASDVIESNTELSQQLFTKSSNNLPWWESFAANGRKLIQSEAIEQGTLTVDSLMERLNVFPAAKDENPEKALSLEELNSLYAAFKFLGLKPEENPLSALQGQAGRSSTGLDGLSGAAQQMPGLVKSPSIKQQIIKSSALSAHFLTNLDQILSVLCAKHQMGFELFVPNAAKQNQLYKNTRFNLPLATLTYRYISAQGAGITQDGTRISSAQSQNHKLLSGLVFDQSLTLKFYAYSTDTKPQAQFTLYHYPALQMYLNPSTLFDEKERKAYVPLTITSSKGAFIFFIGLQFDQDIPSPDNWPSSTDFKTR